MGLFKKEVYLSRNDGISLRDEVLGTFDELYASKLPLILELMNGTLDLSIYHIDYTKYQFQVSNHPALEKAIGKQVNLGFSLDNTWYYFVPTIKGEKDKIYFDIPQVIKRNERRKGHRAELFKRESTRITAIENIGQGIGITGKIKNIGLGRVCVDIERVMSMADEKEIRPSKEIFKKGTKLAIVKFKGIPGVPEIEISAVVNRMEYKGKWQVAINFPKLSGPISGLLKKFINDRGISFYPVIRSREKKKKIEKQWEERKKQETITSTKQPEKVVSNRNINIGIFGDGVQESLKFLKKDQNLHWISILKPLDLIKTINKNKLEYLLIGDKFKEKSMLDLLMKLKKMDILHKIKVFIFFTNEISDKDKSACKELDVKGYYQIPIRDRDLFEKNLRQKIQNG